MNERVIDTHIKVNTYKVPEGVLTVSLTGYFEMVNAARIMRKVAAMVEANNITSFVLDLSGITEMDSTALGTILSLNKYIDSKAAKLFVIGLPQSAQLIVELADLTDHLAIYETFDSIPFSELEVGHQTN